MRMPIWNRGGRVVNLYGLLAELPFSARTCASSALIDEISGALVAERQVTPHGKDVRWHAHLYAIYLAEQAVKNGFVSTETLKAGMKWPTQAGGAVIR